MHNIHEQFNLTETDQKSPIPTREQEMEENAAGGFGFKLDPWKKLDRFLILGTEGGTYYATEKELTVDNARNLLTLINNDGRRVVERIRAFSVEGRSFKQDAILFALALASSEGDLETRRAAYEAFTDVVRTGTHLFQFLTYRRSMAGFGRGMRTAIGDWYNSKDPRFLAYQILKYRQRYGWTHKDVLNVSHPTPESQAHDEIFEYVTWDRVPETVNEDYSSYIHGFEELQNLDRDDVQGAISLIEEFGFTREMVPDELLQSNSVWEALLDRMPLHALVRNLGNLTRRGIVDLGSDWSIEIARRLTDEDSLAKSRMHPMQVLIASKIYTSGGAVGYSQSPNWNPVSKVSDALDAAFYLTFGNVEPTNKKIMLALDVSGSMTSPTNGVQWISCREAAAAMALITANVEDRAFFTAFAHTLQPFDISPRMRLDTVVDKMESIGFGGTDCALPMQYARGYNSDATTRWWVRDTSYKKNRSPITDVDAFVVFTDSETWAGSIHPTQALTKYRNEHNPHAKFAVVAMTSGDSSIVDPMDAGQLMTVGFDTATPNILSGFIRGEV